MALALAAPLVASSLEAGPVAEISAHAAEAQQALERDQVFLAEHRARLALALANTVLGRLEIVDSNLRAAEEALARAAARAPSFALDARALLHGLRASEGNLDPALGELRLLTQMAPEHIETRRQLVLALVHSGTLDEAALELEALRRLDGTAAAALVPWVQPRNPAAAEPKPAQPTLYSGPPGHLPAAKRRALRDSLTSMIASTEALLAAALASGPSADAPAIAGLATMELAQARDALAGGAVKQALEHARRALDAAPSSEGLLRFYAVTALDADLTSIAAPAVETLARMAPESGDYAFLVGRVWLQHGKTGEASEAFLRAVELDPDLLPARRELALTLGAESRYEPAREHLEIFLAAQEDPWRDLDAQAALAEAEERLGDAAAAEARAHQVLERAPDHARARLVLGLVLVDRGEFELARAELEKSVAAEPRLAQAHYRLSFACTRLGDRQCAARHLDLYRRALVGPETEVVPMTRVVPEDPAPMVPKPAAGDGDG